MAERYVSLPKVFACGDIEEWLSRYDICASANGWNDEANALRIPTLLEKEALAIFLDISEEDRKVYENVKQALVKALISLSRMRFA